jgi:hypothetical protein
MLRSKVGPVLLGQKVMKGDIKKVRVPGFEPDTLRQTAPKADSAIHSGTTTTVAV